MTLCSACKGEAHLTVNGEQVGGERVETTPPHGMKWGESCDRCTNSAEVTIR